MKKYNIKNYVIHKEDIKISMPENKSYGFYNRNELVIKFIYICVCVYIYVCVCE